MHVYFSGIGGMAIGPLALIAHKAGYQVSGSDKQSSLDIEYLRQHGITDVHIGQSYEQIAHVHANRPIDWLVYTSALPIEQPDAPELRFCADHGIKTSKRDELINHIITSAKLKLIAIAGTHGKSTTTAMAVWLFKELGLPVSYSVGAKISFGDMGDFDRKSEYFVYEADEYDRNFLAFHPWLSVITGIDWDHPDIYPTRDNYNQAFKDFLHQSEQAVLWQSDTGNLGISPTPPNYTIIPDTSAELDWLKLPGEVNRRNALLVARTFSIVTGQSVDALCERLNHFPGVARRFEQIAPGIFSDYAHTPAKIRGALQLAHEKAGGNVVVVYEGLHNTRQHFIKDDLKDLFSSVKRLYVVPTYLAREDPNLTLMNPADLIALFNAEVQAKAEPAGLDQALAERLKQHAAAGDAVLCLSAGGGNSLDEWLRQTLGRSTETPQ